MASESNDFQHEAAVVPMPRYLGLGCLLSPGPLRLVLCPVCLEPWSVNVDPIRVCEKCGRCDHVTCPCNTGLRDPPLLVLSDEEFDAWLREILGNDAPSVPALMQRLGYRTNGYTTGSTKEYPNGVVRVRKGYERNHRLLTHEYGHVLRYWHAPNPGLKDAWPHPLRLLRLALIKVQFYTHIMGYGLRLYDPLRLREASRAWREKVSA